MVSTRKKRQRDRRFFSQLDDLDGDIFIVDAVSNGQQNVVTNNGSVDQELFAKSTTVY